MVVIRPRRGLGAGGAGGGSARSPALGGSVPPVYYQAQNAPGVQLTKYQSPTAPAAVAPTQGQYVSFDLGNLSVPTIGASVAPGFSATLPVVSDIVELTEDVTETFTGTVTTTLLFANALDHFTLADATGAVVWNQSGGAMQELTNIAFTSPSAGGSFGGASAAVANQTTAQENVNSISGLRLPATRGPWKFTPFYNTITGAGGTEATADTIALRIGGHYGAAGGVTSYYLEQTVTLNSGYNYFAQFAAVKNVSLSGLFLSGITLSDVDEWYIEQNGSVIEPLTTGLALQLRQNSAFPGVTIPSNSLIYAAPVLKTQFGINDSSQSRIHVTSTQSSVKFGYYWLQ